MTPVQQQFILAKVDTNIDMFQRSVALGTASRVDALKAARAQLVDFFAGKAEYKDLPVFIRDFMYEMPIWGTYGT